MTQALTSCQLCCEMETQLSFAMMIQEEYGKFW